MLKIGINNVCRALLFFVFASSLMSFTLVIDAGHGGDDFGAIGLVHGVKEKDLNLQVAKQLASKICTVYPEVKVVLTRETDVFLPLQQRLRGRSILNSFRPIKGHHLIYINA